MLNAPTKAVFGISVIVAIVALIGKLAIASIGVYAFWIMLVAFLILAAGCFLKGV